MRILGIDPGSRLTGFGVINVMRNGRLQYVASGAQWVEERWHPRAHAWIGEALERLSLAPPTRGEPHLIRPWHHQRPVRREGNPIQPGFVVEQVALQRALDQRVGGEARARRVRFERAELRDDAPDLLFAPGDGVCSFALLLAQTA